MKEEIKNILIDNQTIVARTIYNGDFARFEVDTIKTDLDLIDEAAEKVTEVVNEFHKKYSQLKRSEGHIGKTYISTPDYKTDILKKLRKRILLIIKNRNSYEKMGGD